jgi:hypothetical protein
MSLRTDLALDRVAPAKSRKATEVGISRVDFSIVFEGDRREVGVRRKIARRPNIEQQTAQQFDVPRPRLEDRGVRLGEPIPYKSQGLFWCERDGGEFVC